MGPDVDITEIADGEKFVFTAEADVRPEFDLPDYEGIKVTVDDAEVNDREKVDEQLDALQAIPELLCRLNAPRQMKMSSSSTLKARWTASALESTTRRHCRTRSDRQEWASGADDAIRGLSEGESAEFDFTPEEGNSLGKTIHLTVEMKGVRERSLPDADDELTQLGERIRHSMSQGRLAGTKVERMALVEQGNGRSREGFGLPV